MSDISSVGSVGGVNPSLYMPTAPGVAPPPGSGFVLQTDTASLQASEVTQEVQAGADASTGWQAPEGPLPTQDLPLLLFSGQAAVTATAAGSAASRAEGLPAGGLSLAPVPPSASEPLALRAVMPISGAQLSDITTSQRNQAQSAYLAISMLGKPTEPVRNEKNAVPPVTPRSEDRKSSAKRSPRKNRQS